jgi:uncharacterized protein YdaU (DUF1376 family)
MNFDWYPLEPRAFKKKTAHLNYAEVGAYQRLINEYMMTFEGPLPDNDAALARISGGTLDEWLAVAPVVRAFFETSNGKLIHSRCEEELHTQRIRAVERSAAGKAAVEVRWKKHNERKNIIRGVYGSNTEAIRNHTTRQRKKEREGESGSLATAPNGGALREPLVKQQPSPELTHLVVSRWGSR